MTWEKASEMIDNGEPFQYREVDGVGHTHIAIWLKETWYSWSIPDLIKEKI